MNQNSSETNLVVITTNGNAAETNNNENISSNGSPRKIHNNTFSGNRTPRNNSPGRRRVSTISISSPRNQNNNISTHWTREQLVEADRKKLIKNGFLPSPEKQTLRPSTPTINSNGNNNNNNASVILERTNTSQTGVSIMSYSQSNKNNNNNNNNNSSSATFARTASSTSSSRAGSRTVLVGATGANAGSGSKTGSSGGDADHNSLFQPLRFHWMGEQKSESAVLFRVRDPEMEVGSTRNSRSAVFENTKRLLNRLRIKNGSDDRDFSRERLEKGFVSYLDGTHGHSRSSISTYNGFVREKMVAIIEHYEEERRQEIREKRSNVNDSSYQEPPYIPTARDFGPLPPTDEGKGVLPVNNLSAPTWRELRDGHGTIGYNFRACVCAQELRASYKHFENFDFADGFFPPSSANATPRESIPEKDDLEATRLKQQLLLFELEQQRQREEEEEAERQRLQREQEQKENDERERQRLQRENDEAERRQQQKLKEQQEAEEEAERKRFEAKLAQEEEDAKLQNHPAESDTKEQEAHEESQRKAKLQKAQDDEAKKKKKEEEDKKKKEQDEAAAAAAAAAAAKKKAEEDEALKPKPKEQKGCCG